MDKYSYKPLPEGQIRLVRLSLDPSDDTVHAEMKHVELDEKDPPKYRAFSYVWGSVTNPVFMPTKDVTADGAEAGEEGESDSIERGLPITTTLEKGLRCVVAYQERVKERRKTRSLVPAKKRRPVLGSEEQLPMIVTYGGDNGSGEQTVMDAEEAVMRAAASDMGGERGGAMEKLMTEVKRVKMANAQGDEQAKDESSEDSDYNDDDDDEEGEEDGGWIWIDQICINQEDLAEKSIQVANINTVFQCASVVVAWLGDETHNSAQGMEMVRKIGKVAKKLAAQDYFVWDTPGFTRDALETVEEVGLAKSKELGIAFDHLDSWVAFSQLYDRPWYERMWIVQEVLPARRAIALCGEEEASWNDLKNAAVWYSYKAGYLFKKHEKSLLKRSIDGIALTVGTNLSWNIRMGSEYLPQLLGQKTKPVYKWVLPRLLRAFRNRLAGNPRDKVYALLGLSDIGMNAGDNGLKVDYSKTTKEVYAEAMRAVIREDSRIEDGNLDLLLEARKSICACDCRGIWEPDWPSWVPDWRKHFGHGCEWGVGEDFSYRSDRRMPRHKRLVEDEPEDLYKLKVEGVLLGQSVFVSEFSHFGKIIVDSNLRKTRDMVLECYRNMGYSGRYPPSGRSLEEAFALSMIRSVIPARFAEKHPVEDEAIKTYVENYLGFNDAILMPHDTTEEAMKRQDALKPYLDMGFHNDWMQCIMDSYCERRFFVTDKGYMGMGNHNMKDGDVIACLVGLSVPCVLRPTAAEGEFQFVGEAYCHGCMKGEPIHALPVDESEEHLPIGEEIILV